MSTRGMCGHVIREPEMNTVLLPHDEGDTQARGNLTGKAKTSRAQSISFQQTGSAATIRNGLPDTQGGQS